MISVKKRVNNQKTERVFQEQTLTKRNYNACISNRQKMILEGYREKVYNVRRNKE